MAQVEVYKSAFEKLALQVEDFEHLIKLIDKERQQCSFRLTQQKYCYE